MPAEAPSRPGLENATDEYGRIFVLLLVLFAVSMFSEDVRAVRAIVALGVVVVFLGTLRATGVTARVMRTALYAAGVVALLGVGAATTDNDFVLATVGFVAAAGLGLCVVLLVRHIFEAERIRVQEVIGGLTSYALIALGFSYLYSSAARLTDGDFFNNGIAGEASDFVYFSVVTVTTLGYGDLSPATDVGRSLVVLETLLGQILLVVLVAFLVGSLTSGRTPLAPEHRRRRRAGE